MFKPRIRVVYNDSLQLLCYVWTCPTKFVDTVVPIYIRTKNKYDDGQVCQ